MFSYVKERIRGIANSYSNAHLFRHQQHQVQSQSQQQQNSQQQHLQHINHQQSQQIPRARRTSTNSTKSLSLGRNGVIFDPDRISVAHPDYHIGAFLDDGMRPARLDKFFSMPEPSYEEMTRNAWDPNGRSLNIYVKEDDPLTLHRHPIAQSTDCIRGKVGYSKGFHVWQIVWPLRQRGTHAVVGVATKQAPLHKPGYSSLLGSTTESYGWDLVRNVCLHNAKHMNPWPYPNAEATGGERFMVPEKFYCILDMDEGYLAFATNRKYLGVAFRNLHGQTLYPIVCAVWGHCEISIRYMGSLEPEPRSLMEICRRVIRLHLGPVNVDRADELELPERLRDFLLFRKREQTM